MRLLGVKKICVKLQLDAFFKLFETEQPSDERGRSICAAQNPKVKKEQNRTNRQSVLYGISTSVTSGTN